MSEQAKVHEPSLADDGASSIDATASTAATASAAERCADEASDPGAGAAAGSTMAASTTTASATIEREDESDADIEKGAKGPGALIAEARRYRKRAQTAEQSLQELKARLAEREAAIGEQQQAIAALERRQAIDESLRQGGAIDFEVARTLVDSALSQNAAVDAAAAVQELQRSKPYLFRQAKRAMSAGVQCARQDEGEETSREQRLVRAAEDAQSSGQRGDVLRYLRLRRKS